MLKEQVDVEDGQEEWGEYVLYRDEIPDRLPGILERKRIWRETEKGQGIVGVSFHTDCFMDRRAGDITAAVIEALADHGRYARVLTRNTMLASSYMETFVDAGEHVIVGASIPTLEERYIEVLEPSAPSIQSRIQGLERFRESGVPVFVSMSPTYPTITSRGEMRELMEAIASLEPEVVFHEPINPRGKNFEMTVAAAEEGGVEELARSLVEIQSPDAWVEYACRHFRWVQELSDELEVPVQLWPDKALVNQADDERARWLQAWRERQSPEEFAGRVPPETEMPGIPEGVGCEVQSGLDAF